MLIRVKTPPTYRRPDLQNKDIEIQPGTSLRKFMADKELSDSSVAYVIINEQKAQLDQILNDGDHVSFIPMMAGG